MAGQKRERQSNIELLRVIMMLSIIAHHFVKHNAFKDLSQVVLPNRIWLHLLWLLGKVGVNAFVMITGYFMTSPQTGLDLQTTSRRFNKLFHLIATVFFYSFPFYLLYCATGLQAFKKVDLIVNALPVINNHWRFATTYIMLLIISPYINCFICSLEKGDYLRMLVILGLLWSVLPMFMKTNLQCSNLVWMTYLYCLAGYLRLWAALQGSARRYLVAAAISLLLTLCLTLRIEVLSERIPILQKYVHHFDDMRTFPAMFTAGCLFIGFEKLTIPRNRIINYLGAMTFGVYLFHEEDVIRALLWKRLFHIGQIANSPLLIPYTIAIVLSVFAVAVVVETLRSQLIERLYSKNSASLQHTWPTHCFG